MLNPTVVTLQPYGNFNYNVKSLNLGVITLKRVLPNYCFWPKIMSVILKQKM